MKLQGNLPLVILCLVCSKAVAAAPAPSPPLPLNETTNDNTTLPLNLTLPLPIPPDFRAIPEFGSTTDPTTLHSISISSLRALSILSHLLYRDTLTSTTFPQEPDSSVQLGVFPQVKYADEFVVREAMWGLLLCADEIERGGYWPLGGECVLSTVTQVRRKVVERLLGKIVYWELGKPYQGEGGGVPAEGDRMESQGEVFARDGALELNTSSVGLLKPGGNLTGSELSWDRSVSVSVRLRTSELKERMVFYAFGYAIIDAASKVSRPDILRSYTFAIPNSEGLRVRYGPGQNFKALKYTTLVAALAQLPEAMEALGQGFGTCDFTILDHGIEVGTGSLDRI